jgi:uncharacterized protein YbjT (DUF2867 family)
MTTQSNQNSQNSQNNQHTPKVALIIGASGLVGQHLLLKLLASNHYSQVIALVRNPLPISHTKLIQKKIDFEKLANELSQLSQPLIKQENTSDKENFPSKVDHIFFTLGSTIKKAGSKSAFNQIDYLYPLIIAKHFYQQHTALFAIVTAMAANESSSLFYNQVKGKVELALRDIGYQHLGLFRPSMLAGHRDEFRLGEQLGSLIMKAFAFMIPKKYQLIQAEKVANAMLAYAEHPPSGITIIQSDQLQSY